ncbi:MAG: UDP-glucose/GDP-mannose dehydrogenase family protein [Gammaproteobacteria bacterium]|nr:UDP-glucose/GDP-mannose dehydrogenase family protein [Gammaproteobacteria bacterium]
MKVVMIGSGYVGLVSGACFAEFGADVTCVDVDPNKIDRLRRGEIPIYEPGLDDLVSRNVAAGRLGFTTELASAVGDADLVFIAVGTPTRRGDGHADLSYVYQAARDIAPHLEDYTVIVDKSTVPVGTARNVARIIRETNPNAEFDVASNPEFLREGAAIGDFMRPDRVVLGVENPRAEARLRELYRPLNLIEVPILVTNLESAELIKYASNAFLATKISFINEMSTLCEAVGADVHSVARGMGMDKRIGAKFLHPGPGYGGSCFPKDTLALVRIAQEHGSPSRIVESVIEVNAAQKARMIKKIRQMLGGSEAGKTIGVLGLTFKPETDDMRDSPALSILPALLEKGARVRVYDPKGMDEAKHLLPTGIEYCENAFDVFTDADAGLLLTEWNAFRGMDLNEVKSRMRGNVFVDLRNVYDPTVMRAAGFAYDSVGRP